MKRIIIYIFFFLIPFWAYSQKVEESTARKVAERVLKMDKPDLAKQLIERTIPIGLDNDTLYFIFTYPDDGFAIVSAESAAPPVLGHCKKGKYEPENMPPGLLYLLEKYKYWISGLRENEVKQTKQIEEQWASYLKADIVNLKSYNVGTYMLETEWSWGGDYNQFCPGIDRPAGCTAVAMAQILKHWECRTVPTGYVSYPGRWNIFVGKYLGASENIGATTYNWTDMHDLSADVDNALLIYHAGVSCETFYGLENSYAPPGRARDGFVNNWGLSSSADVKWRISHLSNWQDMLEDELDLGRPLLYVGGSVGPAHSWVIDGYDNLGGFHCNWGWGGDYNDFYYLGGFDPGGNGPFNQYESAIFNVFPEQQRVTGPSFVCTSNSTFTLHNAALGSTVSWTATGVTPSFGTGSTASFHSTCPANRNAQITFTIASPCDNTQFIKYFASGGPGPGDLSLSILDAVTGQGVDQWSLCPNTTYYIYLENNSSCSISNYNWTLPYGMTQNFTSQNMVSVNTNSSYGGMLMVHGKTCCTGCGSNVLLLTEQLMTDGYDCGGGWYMGFTPNPTSNETTLELKTENIAKYTEGDEWEMEIYSQQQVLTEKVTKLTDSKHIINTTGWKEGIYFVRVKINSNVYSGKFIVAR